MLAPDFAAEIGRVGTGESVTAIFSWRAPGHVDNSSGAIARAKQILIDELGVIEGVRINPLPDFPQLIVAAPAGVWQSFIRRNAWLRNSDQVDVVGNHQIFQII